MEKEELHKDFAYQFMRGWNASLEKVAEMIKDYKFSHDRLENLAIRKDVNRELRDLVKSNYDLNDVGIEDINDSISEKKSWVDNSKGKPELESSDIKSGETE